MLSGGVAVQILTSGSNFIVGLLLIRRTSDIEYGSYVLITTAVVMATTLQGSFIQPPMLIRLTRSDRDGRAALIGGLYRDQNRLVPLLLIPLLAIVLFLSSTGRLDVRLAVMLVAGTAAMMTTLHREFFRMALFAYRLPNAVLRADTVYCLLLVGGAALATLGSFPAAFTALSMAVAALVGRYLLSKSLWRHESWNRKAPYGMLREIFHQGAWSAFGGGMHYLFGQGYTYIVAGSLSVSAVAALAATRLAILPVNLLSNGIGAVMLPTVAKWNHAQRASVVLRRVTLFAFGLMALMGAYLVVMWLTRDWIFTHILKKKFADRDLLLVVWSVISLVTVFRDQFMYFLVVRGRFQSTSSVTFACAVVSLTTTFIAVHHFGAIGAPIGVLTGETLNILGTGVLSVREARARPGAAPLTA
jgi:O-antigen/teichoic acid export membrane protein